MASPFGAGAWERARKAAAAFRAPRNLPTAARQLIATARNDITIPLWNDVLRPRDETLIQRGGAKGLALYDEIERDNHAYAVLMKRRLELTSREWVVEPASEDQADVEAADFMRDVLERMALERLMEGLLDATLKGFSVAEIVWMLDRERDAVVPERVLMHDQRRFAFDEDWRPRLLTREEGVRGIELPERKFIVHRFGTKPGDPYGRGLGTRLFWPVLFKREGVAFWLVFLEKYASPTPVGKVPFGMLEQEQRALLDSLEGLAQRSAITIPMGAELDYLEAKRSTPGTHQEWCRFWDEQMSEAVLGETLSTNIGSIGSQAAAKVHTEGKSIVIDADGDHLADTCNETLIAWIHDYNRPNAGRPSIYWVRPKNEKALAEARREIAQAEEAEIAALEKAIRLVGDLEEVEALRALRELSALAQRLTDDALGALLARPTPQPVAIPAAAEGNEGDAEKDDGEDPAFAAPGDVFATPHMADALFDAFALALDRALADWLTPLHAALRAASTTGAVRRVLVNAGSADALADRLGDALRLAHMVGAATVIDEAHEDGLSRADLFGDAEAFGFADEKLEFEGAPFDEAMRFLRAKTLTPTETWHDIAAEAHDTSFTVAGETSRAVLDEIRELLTGSLDDGGEGLEGFRKDLEVLIASGKWSGDPRLATDPDVLGSRTRVIWWTNLSNAHAAGRRRQQMALTHVLPFLQYRHGATRTSLRPREKHVAFDGLTLPADDPTWDSIYAPNGWFCSCAVRAITAAMAGRVKAHLRRAPTDDAIRAAIDPEWRHAPGATADDEAFR